MVSAESLHAALPEAARRTLCSWNIGWRNVLLRSYQDPLTIDCFETTRTQDQKIVLVTNGSCLIQNLKGASSSAAIRYRCGHVGLVAPGESAKLRWHGNQSHGTLQLHIGADIVTEVIEALFGQNNKAEPLSTLALLDRTVETTMLALRDAVVAGAPELYGESAAHYLVAHLLLKSTWRAPKQMRSCHQSQVGRLEDFMHAHLGRTLSLSELAGIIGVSRFQLLRIAQRTWGETPQRHLTRLRLNRACHLLSTLQCSVLEIALECGFTSPAHFATAFRRFTGVTPTEFRQRNACKSTFL